MSDNNPIIGCPGCQTTGGRMSCSTHGQTNHTTNVTIPVGGHYIKPKDNWGHSDCPKHGEFTCPDCTEDMAVEISKVTYQHL